MDRTGLTLRTQESGNRWPRPLRLFWAMNVILGIVCLGFEAVWRHEYHLGQPYNSPVLTFYHWTDLLRFQSRFVYLHTPLFFTKQYEYLFMYPAPVALLYEAFYLTGHPVLAFFCLTGGLCLVLTVLLGAAMARAGANSTTTTLFLFSMLAMSYPLWFVYSLGNMEVCIFLLVAFGILAFLRGHLYVAAVLLGFAAAMKIFPFVYFALLLTRKAYRQLAAGAVAAVALNLAALWIVCPPIPFAYRQVQQSLLNFRRDYMLPFLPFETGLDHSAFGFIKAVTLTHIAVRMPPFILTAYLAVVACIGISLYFLVIRKLPLLNQVLSLCILSILLPPTSHDYTLLNLYVPFGLLIIHLFRLRQMGQKERGLTGAFVCFGILLSAESELIRNGLGRSGQLKAVTLVVLLVIALRTRWVWPGLGVAEPVQAL